MEQSSASRLLLSSDKHDPGYICAYLYSFTFIHEFICSLSCPGKNATSDVSEIIMTHLFIYFSHLNKIAIWLTNYCYIKCWCLLLESQVAGFLLFLFVCFLRPQTPPSSQAFVITEVFELVIHLDICALMRISTHPVDLLIKPLLECDSDHVFLCKTDRVRESSLWPVSDMCELKLRQRQFKLKHWMCYMCCVQPSWYKSKPEQWKGNRTEFYTFFFFF